MKRRAFLAVSAIALPAFAIDTDLSDDINNPSVLILEPGSNPVGNTVVSSGNAPPVGDIDFLTVVVPEGLQLDRIELSRYEGFAVSFLGLSVGPISPANPSGSGAEQALFVAESLGFALFGQPLLGSNLLPNIAVGDVTIDAVNGPFEFLLLGSERFDPTKPLAAGSYALVIQDTGPSLVTYELDFQASVVPEPAAAMTVLLGSFAAATTRRRRSTSPTNAMKIY